MPNRLSRETSPYLQQHADNPVDWYPWGEEALAEARRTNKPILLSVGYSACHWCHVMAHESFEDPAIAKVMNDLFVNIKVDREERPDIDQIYQLAQVMLTRRNGGWPLTMFLTPDQLPFFGGTYFPNVAKYGMPAFVELIARVRAFYDESPGEIREQGEQLRAALARMQPRGGGNVAKFTGDPLDEAAGHLLQSMDPVHGGFTGAPKFPHPDTIELLLRRHAALGEKPPLDAAVFTLRKMAEGGIYDQLGGGFARYSVDERWAIPHFEKMLYDNGWLLRLYADAWTVTRDPLFRRVCEETCAWVMREMQSPAGGYYSSLDADSEGEEGRYYVWTVEEIRAHLTPEEFAVTVPAFGLDGPPNFEGHAWHLVVARAVEDPASRRILDRAREKLFSVRETRVRPGRDEKILASWNALMIRGMAHAARVFGRRDWLDSARAALAFIRRELWKDGHMLATARDGHAHLNAYLDDHAYLLAALLEMLEADFDPADLAWASDIGRVLIEEFRDPVEGGFFFTSHDHESLIHRPKPGPDNATPSGNAVAAWALNRLALLTGEMRFAEAAEATLALFWHEMERQPMAFGTMLCALEELLEPPRTVILSAGQEALAPWRQALEGEYLPTTLVLAVGNSSGLPGPLAKPASRQPVAWLCKGATCLPPIATPAGLREGLALPTIAPSTESTPAPRSSP
ncbi:MAG TPA: thioredoxin domain-containing protein [Usitatibacter sp.]|nr:thioredoxin domain-containing protein [Usitatibacter sp.]